MDGVSDGDDIERFEEERELELYREYRDVLPMFAYVIETERRFYLANKVDVTRQPDGWVQPHSLFATTGAGTYQFRARLRNSTTAKSSGFSPPVAILVP